MKTLLMLAAVILSVISLAGCVTQGAGPGVTLPKAPSHYQACFNKLSPIPANQITRADVVRLVAELRKSELAKSQCGKDLLAWYDTVRTSFAKKKG